MHGPSPHALDLGSGPVTLLAGKPAADATANTVPLVRRMIRMATRWRWVLLGGVAAGALFGIVLTLVMTRQYGSTTRLEISRETARVVNIDSVERDTSIGDQEFYQTQYGLLQTQALAERVARDLGVVDDPSFFRMFGRSDLFAGTAAEQNGAARRAKRSEVAGKILLHHVGIAPVRGSSLVDITVITPDPALSLRIAQNWGQDFIDSNLERRFEKSSYARRFLEQRLEQLRQKLEVSERQAVEYAARQGIINLPQPGTQQNGGTTGDRSLVTDDLTSFNAALEEATVDRIRAESRLRDANRADASSEALSNDAIAVLRQKRAETAAEYAKLQIIAQPNYPQAKALASQIQAIDAALGREEGRIRTSLAQAFAAARAREQTLQGHVDALKTNLSRLRHVSIQYNIYQRDADTNRELYNALLQRYKEIGVAGNIENNNVAIVDVPKLAERPSSPRLLVNLILAMLAGTVLGVIAATILEQIDEGIVDPSDVHEKLGLALLGTVPRVRQEEPLDALRNTRSQLVEAYLAIQASLELSTAHGTPRSLAVISTRPKEGKSTTTIALAQSLARARRRVVLVDADLRSPSLHAMFAIPNRAGVSNFLAGADDLDALLRTSGHEGLSLLTAGPPPPNAADLLTGERLSLLVARLQERFDHVIVDSPPVLGLADAPLVASAVENVLFVVEAASIQLSAVHRALERLRTTQAKVLGAVLTKFEARRAHLGFAYAYGYDYGERADA